MRRLLIALSCGALTLFAFQQREPAGLTGILNFEAPHSGSLPTGWSASPPAGIALDDKVVHGGRWSVRIERQADSAQAFSGIVKDLPLDVSGATIELHGFIRTADVSDFAALWLREDGESGPVAFESLQKQRIHGTSEWAEYSISVPVHPEARQLYFGFLLSGTGKAWVDDMRLLVDGKPIWDAPKAERPKTVLDTDREFDGGSKIVLKELTAIQIDNLATLGRVWGFLKYHHPRVTSGQRHWDYDLFRVLPETLAARDRTTANTVLSRWVASLGAVNACQPCAKFDEAGVHLHPDLALLDAEAQLGADLSRTLRTIHRNRAANGKQFYVSLAPGVGNPVFQNEPGYSGVKLPDAGFQLLALYRFWNIIEYWFPYRDVVGEDWNRVLVEFIPKIALAKTAGDFQRELMALIARVHDSHANLWSSMQVRPPAGDCEIPVAVRFIEKRAVVTGYLDASAWPGSGLKPGDAIEVLDGVPIPDLVKRWTAYYAASNEAALLRDMAGALTKGACGDSSLRVLRGKDTIAVNTKRLPGIKKAGSGIATHDRPGDTFQRLRGDVAYLKLSSIKTSDAASYFERAAGTKGIVIDIRNYPSDFAVFSLGALLVDMPAPFVRFTTGDLVTPGAFHFTPPISVTPGKPHYSGKIAILVDEVTQSQAEYTGMAFRAAPNAKVIGSTTAGADGNVSQIPLPGGLSSMISGIGVFYPDKRPTQRVGIIPDLEVKPTIAGIRDGRDEVLDAALQWIEN